MDRTRLPAEHRSLTLGGRICERIYADYLAGNRLEEYRRLAESSLALDFCHWTLADLNASIATNSIAPDAKVFVHRHDIDTDVGGARAFFEIEKSLGIRATYYFRLNTIDRDLMREINGYGSEVGYHYEELATLVKHCGRHTRAAALAHMDAITAEFARNFRSLEQSLGFKIRSVASHGDFANRRIGMQNTEILDNDELRRRLGIECEGYDASLMAFFEAYLSDDLPTRPYKRGSPFEAIQSKRSICLLTHPRHWRTNVLSNTGDNLWRAGEEIEWQLRRIFGRCFPMAPNGQ